MTFAEFLRGYFNSSVLARLIEAQTPADSVIFNRVFTNRQNRATDMVNLAQITRATKSMPVISRGGQAIPLDPKNASSTWIEPLAVRLSDYISGATLNRLKALWNTGDNGQNLVQAELDKIISDLMRSSELTRNALCAQALTGTINYQQDSNGMKERYIIKFGDTQTYTLGKLLSEPDATLVDLIMLLNGMKKKMADEGFAGSPIILAGSNAFSTICNLITATPYSERFGASINSNVVSITGFNIELDDGSYADTDEAGKTVIKDAVDKNKMVMVLAGYAELDYMAIDDVNGNLQALPFFSKTIEISDPSGFKVISESKPMPLVAPKAICWATVTDSLGARSPMNININTSEGRRYTNTQLTAFNKEKILTIAKDRGYDMTKTAANTKEEIITEFLDLQTKANI